MDCGLKFVKCLVFIFNLVFFLTGLLLVTLGSVSLSSKEFQVLEESSGDGANLQHLSIGLIAFGAVVMIITFLGCCGAWNENACMLTTFAVIIGFIFMAEIVIGVMIFVKKDEIRDYLAKNKEFKEKLLRGYYTEGEDRDAYKELWDGIQYEYKCCGFHKAEDWTLLKYDVPISCCKDKPSTCSVGDAYKQGCHQAIEESVLNKNALRIGIGILVLALIQVMAIVFACCLARAIKSERLE